MSDALTAGLSLSPAEIEVMKAEMSPAEFAATMRRHADAARRNVFGQDHRTDKNGNPIEQGFGSAQHPSENSIAAYRKYRSSEPDFAENVARMQKELADYNARRGKAA